MYIPYDPTIEENMWKNARKYFGVEYEEKPDIDTVKCSLENFSETCLIDEFFKQNPDARSCCITCNCPKCSPRC